MKLDQLELEPRIRAAVRRANLSCVEDVLCGSVLDLLRVTGLSHAEVQQLLTAAAACRPRPPLPALLLRGGEGELRLSLGCPVLDQLLRGGLPVGGVTELCGEAGAGKTQLALQLCVSVQNPTEHGGLNSGAVYICTEDSFPVGRLHQLIREHSGPGSVSMDQVFVEHAADLDSLQDCLSRRVPLLLARRLVRLVVLDSVAALFRSEFQVEDWMLRHKQLISCSASLHHLVQVSNTAVLCINQVTDVFSRSDSLGPLSSNQLPALGLAWANQVCVRMMMRRLSGTVQRSGQSSAPRRLEVLFAPHVARDGRDVAVWREGVRGLC